MKVGILVIPIPDHPEPRLKIWTVIQEVSSGLGGREILGDGYDKKDKNHT